MAATVSERISDGLSPTQAERLWSPFLRFSRVSAASGIVLVACAVIALIWANSPWRDSYFSLFERMRISIGVGTWGMEKPLVIWINDALMAVFFFLVGLEIKREFLVGELNSVRKAAFPVIAAVGGMAVPGLFFVAVQLMSAGAHAHDMRGWGVPTATDIAFALGILALLGDRIPLGLRVFLTTLAIADDLGALVIIAVFYTDELHSASLGLAGVAVIIMAMMNIMGVRRAWIYAVVGLVLWYFVLKSGVHATIAGVVGALTIPVRSRVGLSRFVEFGRRAIAALPTNNDAQLMTSSEQHAVIRSLEEACERVQTPLHRLEHSFHPWVAFIIVPVFALANAGVQVQGSIAGAFASPVTLAVMAGLVLGKPIGITLASWLACKCGAGVLPAGVTWRQIHGAAWLGGIGFTMSLFIANLAYGTGHSGDGATGPSPALDAAKVGILAGSTIAAVVGLLILRTGHTLGARTSTHS